MKTKKELNSMCSNLLYKSFLTEDDKKFLYNILEMHPKSKSKIGVGVKDFFIKKTPYGNLGFCILRNDNSTTDFSFKKCLYSPTIKTKIRKACRCAIEDTIKTIKTKPGNIIHHNKIEFEKIVLSWLDKNPNIDLEIIESLDNSYKTIFKNKATIKSFIEYHNSIAELIEITPEQHKIIHSKW